MCFHVFFRVGGENRYYQGAEDQADPRFNGRDIHDCKVSFILLPLSVLILILLLLECPAERQTRRQQQPENAASTVVAGPFLFCSKCAVKLRMTWWFHRRR